MRHSHYKAFRIRDPPMVLRCFVQLKLLLMLTMDRVRFDTPGIDFATRNADKTNGKARSHVGRNNPRGDLPQTRSTKIFEHSCKPFTNIPFVLRETFWNIISGLTRLDHRCCYIFLRLRSP